MKHVIPYLLLLGLAPAINAQTQWTEFTSPLPSGSTPVDGLVNGIAVDLIGGYFDQIDDGAGQDEGWVQAYNNGGNTFASGPFSPNVSTLDSIYFYTGSDSATNNQTYSIDFATPVTDPLIHISDLNLTTIDWGLPFTLVSSNADLSAGPFFSLAGGTSGSGTIQFSGLHSSLNFDILNGEAAAGEVFEIAVGYDEGLAVPEPSGAFLGLLTGGLLLLRRKR